MVINDYKDAEQVLKSNLENRVLVCDIDSNYGTYRVLQYLPIVGKANLLQYVINGAMDAETGCFSPVRVEVYYAVGIFKAYCGVHLDESTSVTDVYDQISQTGLLDTIIEAIPEKEKQLMDELLYDTIDDIARYNNSFASVVSSMASDSNELNSQIEEIMQSIKNREGMEVLSEIKNVVGTD